MTKQEVRSSGKELTYFMLNASMSFILGQNTYRWDYNSLFIFPNFLFLDSPLKFAYTADYFSKGVDASDCCKNSL